MFIYKISFPNNKIYIGQTIQNPNIRWSQHKSDANKNKTIVSKAIKKYGYNNCTFEIIDETNNIDKLNELEIKYIKEYNCIIPNGYNVSLGGNNKCSNEITKNKIRNSLLGRKHTTVYKEKLAQSWGNKPFYVFKNDKIIGEFISMNDCSNKLNIPRPSIKKCLNKIKGYKQSLGYTFLYKDEFTGEIPRVLEKKYICIKDGMDVYSFNYKEIKSFLGNGCHKIGRAHV